jgi:hypothetical protein
VFPYIYAFTTTHHSAADLVSVIERTAAHSRCTDLHTGQHVEDLLKTDAVSA